MRPDLALGIAAGVTVVTPNRRLAVSLKREFDDIQAAKGLVTWNSADILPLSAFIQRAYEDALYSDVAPAIPLLLTPAQERHLWEEAIGASAWADSLLAPAQTAAQCREAWQLAHEWRIAGALASWEGNEDTRAFAAWSRAYLGRCERDGNIDPARLPDLVGGLLQREAVRKPKVLITYAFDLLCSQERDFLDLCARAGIEIQAGGPVPRRSIPVSLAFDAAADEYECAAQWARARLEASANARIGVVVPDLDQRRKEIARIFSRMLYPAGTVLDAASPPAFNISLGEPLAEYPLAHAALAVLALAHGELDFALASRLVRSPFLGGAETEATQRARLDAALRKSAPPVVTLPRLLGLIGVIGADCPQLMRRLSALFERAGQGLSGSRSPQEWARQYSALLDAAGFPGERALDSSEFQAREKLHEALTELARLERVAPRLAARQALARLQRICSDTLFQPESGAAPIQVLGAFESAGLEFDHLWIGGMIDEAWPLAARPNPFVPLALQKKAGVPQAAAEASLARDKRMTAGWLAAADEVVVSHPLREKDRDLLVSPLVAAVPSGAPQALRLPEYPDYADLIYLSRLLEPVPDGAAPPPAVTEVRGGAVVLADQAACPFRAFARHRLGAQALETPVPGLNAADRGTLMHVLLKSIWDELKSSKALATTEPGRLDSIIANAAAAAIAAVGRRRPGVLEGRFAELERERLGRLAREWIETERRRPAFVVVASEDPREIRAAGLSLRGRIDRIDRLESGGHALVDYKTGKTSVSGWLGERPDDPQLPLYAVNAKERIAAVVFAKVRVGEMKFEGLSEAEQAVPGAATLAKSRVKLAKRYGSWSELQSGWKNEIESLGREFCAGDARVDPKWLARTCERCDLQPLCRVRERLAVLSSGDNDGENGE